MDYVNRFFERFSPTRFHRRPHFSYTPRAPANSPQRRHSYQSNSSHKQKHRRQQHKMTSFNGPSAKDLDSLKKTVQSIPEKYKSSYSSASKATINRICDPGVLHLWESDSDIDNLLQLTSVITKLCNLGVRKSKDVKTKPEEVSMLVLAEERGGRDNYKRICELVAYLTEREGKKHLEGTVCSFGKIVVVRGWNNSVDPTGTGNKEAAEKVNKRINVAIERVFKMGGFEGNKMKIVWHHGPVIHFMLHWINATTNTLRSALSAITITGSLDLTSGVAPSPAGRANKLPDLERLETYAKKLDIPVVFLDSPSQLITSEYLGLYMCYYAYYINTFLPPSLARPHLGKAQDELVTFAFQLRGANENKYGSDVVRMVQKHLDAGKAKHWARMCVDKASYEKSKCRAAGKDAAIHHAVQLADSPFALLNHYPSGGIPAFARLFVGPAASSPSTAEHYVAAPLQINFKAGQLRPCNPATFHLLLPSPSPTSTQDSAVDKVSSRIQGLMMAVLDCVLKEKGNPKLGDTERGVWKGVVKAVEWAVDGCEAGKMPKGVSEKVKFVKGKLREGTWGYALGVAKGGGDGGGVKSGSANAMMMPEPNRTYGFGQTNGMYGYGGGQQGVMAPRPSPQGAGQMPYGHAQGQPQGMDMDPTMYAPGHGYSYAHGQRHGYAPPQQQRSGRYPPQGQQGSAEAYPQSMGGPW
ncbi:hypothetical protein N0V83_005556 [Neocucurbitaria cava]|uniref:Uncharacterized protein n=1 Tax=Neocucurbitaria cava TaxID=798079 RepID=A0A9W9CMC8_9PLEO|nr:hypothetical protein N0V83_005556 [Neocucurbitaria cava]